MSFFTSFRISSPIGMLVLDRPTPSHVILNEVKNLVLYRDLAMEGLKHCKIIKDEILHFVQNDMGWSGYV